MINEGSMAILSDMNLASLRNIEDTDGRSNESISDMIATLRCLIASEVHVQSWM